MRSFFLLAPLLPAVLYAGVSVSDGTWTGAACSGCTRPVTYTISCANDGAGTAAELQAVYDDAWRGDTIKLNSVSATGNQCYWNQVTDNHPLLYLRRRPGSSGYITITTSEDEKLPADGARVTPAYKPVMPILQTPSLSSHPALIFGGTESAAEYVKLRGLWIRKHPTNKSALLLGVVAIGHSHHSPMLPYFWETRLTGGAAAGATTLNVSGVWRLARGMTVTIANRQGANPETVVIDSVGTNTITLTAPTTVARAFGDAVRVPVDSAARQPDNIVIQHCILEGGNETIVRRLISLDARTVTIRDNYMDGPMDNISGSDSQVILAYNGPGPYTIENNYISGGSENIMLGGSKPSFDVEVDSALIRFNYLVHIPERDRHGPWQWTQESNHPLNGGRNYGINNINGNPRLVFKGRHVHPSNVTVGDGTGGSKGFFRASNTGIVGTIEPDWYSVPPGGSIYDGEDSATNSCANPGTGVCWIHMGTNARPMVKNNFEIKSARNVTLQYNVLDWHYDAVYPGSASYNALQAYILVVKAVPVASPGSAGCANDSLVFPDCYRARTTGFRMLNNLVRSFSGGLHLMGGQTGKAGAVGDYLVKDNLLIRTEPIVAPFYPLLQVGPSANQNGYASDDSLHSIRVENNTWYAPHMSESYTILVETQRMTIGGKNSFSGNVLPRGGAVTGIGGLRGSYGGDGAPGSINLWPGTAGLGKNVIIGSPTGSMNYLPSTVFSNCPGTAACPENWDYDDPVYGRLLNNPASGFFDIRDTHGWAKRAMSDGLDIGADVTRVPQILNLQVLPTDRLVLLRWTVTEPILDVPCVAEVSTRPDFDGGYAAELADIRTHHGQDTDMADRNIRYGNERMISMGYAATLSPSTTYYYRLQCGGDTRRGMFTTLPATDGTTERTISRRLQDPAATGMEVEYGTWHSRWSSSIGDGGKTTAECGDDGTCTATFSVPKGSVVHYRWTEVDQSGTALQSGPVLVFTAP